MASYADTTDHTAALSTNDLKKVISANTMNQFA
jgi:hypothetical protein